MMQKPKILSHNSFGLIYIWKSLNQLLATGVAADFVPGEYPNKSIAITNVTSQRQRSDFLIFNTPNINKLTH